MKTKISLAVISSVLCLLQNPIFAQDNPTIPSKNAFMAELNFKPFGENIISFNQLQVKCRVNDQVALRLGLAFDHNKLDLPGDDYHSSEPRKVSGNEKTTKFGFLPGIEFHFLKDSKISPYWGIELSFFTQSVKSHYKDYKAEYISGKINYVPVETDIDGATRLIDGNSYYFVYSDYPKRSFSSFGGNLLLGCDYYFMRNLYVGVEFGLGYNHINNKKVTIDISDQVNPTILPSYTVSKFGFYYNSALRLGFWF